MANMRRQLKEPTSLRLVDGGMPAGYQAGMSVGALRVFSDNENARRKDVTDNRGIDVQASSSKYGADQQLAGTSMMAGASRYGADQQLAGANVAASASRYGADQGLAGQKYASSMSSAASMYGADKASQSSMYGADQGLAGQKYASSMSSAASMYGADRASQSSMYGADQGLAGQKYASSMSSAASMYGADRASQSSMYGADKGFAGQKYSADSQLRGTAMQSQGNLMMEKYRTDAVNNKFTFYSPRDTSMGANSRDSAYIYGQNQQARSSDFNFNDASNYGGGAMGGGLRFKDGGGIDAGQGGVVPGTGTGDKIPAKYEPGEFVVSNDMLNAQPELRDHLRSLREDVLATKGMTPAQADYKATHGGKGLRAEAGGGDFKAEAKPAETSDQRALRQLAELNGVSPEHSFTPTTSNNSASGSDLERNITNGLNALGGMGVVANVPLKMAAAGGKALERVMPAGVALGNNQARLAAPAERVAATVNGAPHVYNVGANGVATAQHGVPAVYRAAEVAEAARPIIEAIPGLREGAQANRNAAAVRGISGGNALAGAAGGSGGSDSGTDWSDYKRQMGNVAKFLGNGARAAVSAPGEDFKYSAQSSNDTAPPLHGSEATSAVAADNSSAIETSERSRRRAHPAAAPETVLGTDGRRYLPGAVSTDDHTRSDKLINEAFYNRPRNGTDGSGNGVTDASRWGYDEGNMNTLRTDKTSLRKYNEGLAARGSGIQVSQQANGSLRLSDSSAPEKMRYTDMEGKPTSEYRNTNQYAEGVKIAAGVRERVASMEASRLKREAEGHARQAAESEANQARAQRYENGLARKSADTMMGSNDPITRARGGAALAHLDKMDADQAALASERNRNAATIKAAEIAANANTKNHEITAASSKYTADKHLEGQQAPALLAAQQNKVFGYIMNAAKENNMDPVKMAEYMRAPASTIEQIQKIQGTKQTQEAARSEQAGKAMKGMFNTVVDNKVVERPDLEAQAAMILNRESDGKWDQLGHEERAKRAGAAHSHLTLLDSARQHQNNGWLQMVGLGTPDTPWGGMPTPEQLSTATVKDVGFGNAKITPNVKYGDKALTYKDASGRSRTMYLSRDTSGEHLKYLADLGVNFGDKK